MIKNFLALAALTLFMSLAGCSNENSKTDNEVKEFVIEYKTKQYTVADPGNPHSREEAINNIKPYLLEEVLAEQIANRSIDIPAKVAAETRSSIALESVTLENVEAEGKYNKYKYTLHLIFTKGDKEELVDRKGELTIFTEGEMVITRDWENQSSEVFGVKF